MPHRSAPLVLVALAVTALAVGCAGGSGEAAPTPTATPSATAEPTPTPTVAASVQCLESGTWVVDAAREAALFADGLSSHATEVTAEYTGEAAYTFSDGELTRTYTAWREHFGAVLQMAGLPHITETATHDGTTTAAYEVTETGVVTQEAEVSGLAVDVTATRDGAPVTFEDAVGKRLASQAEAQSWAFTCEGDTLRLVERGEDGQPGGDYATTVLQRR